MARPRKQATSQHRRHAYPVWSIMGILYMALLLATTVRADTSHGGWSEERGPTNTTLSQWRQ